MTKVLFLVDQHAASHRTAQDRHPGGAELTDAAALDVCPWPVETSTFVDLDLASLDGYDVILLGNSQSASPEVLEAIAATGRHVLFEHDLRICDWRGNLPFTRDLVHRHYQRCWCPHLSQQRLYDTSLGVIFLTSLQQAYFEENPFFRLPPSRVLGCSLFAPDLFERREKVLARGAQRSGMCIFASPQRIKGAHVARRYCEERGVVPDEIRGMRPEQVLEVYESHETFVYLPIGPEWAGRMVVEARVLGCDVVVNRHVGVAQEPFWSGPRDAALHHLADGPKRFWRQVEELMNERPRVRPEERKAALGGAADVTLRGLRKLRVPSWLSPLPKNAPPSVSPAW